ncbi:MAG: hypothetical protein ACJAZS_000303 [Alteromonas naphthalenivorans]|jgi:hypothetical protein
MNKKILILTITLASTYVHAQKIITLSVDNPHTFSIASSFKKNPISVHQQNQAYLSLSCKHQASFKDHFIHQCTVKAQENAPKGTFALFKNTLEDAYRHLFHVTIE